MLTTEQAAWLAGYIDGDGCICLSRPGGKKYRAPFLVIDSCDLEILEFVMSICGGSLRKKTKYAAHHRQAWTWRLLGAANVARVLERVLPFLRCADKKSRASMIVLDWKSCTPRNGVYTPALREKKEDFERRFLAIGAGRGKRICMEGEPVR